MKKFLVSGVLCALVVLGGAQSASAETASSTSNTSTSEMLAKIQDLMKLIASLKEQLDAAKGELKELAMDLDLGAENEDVRKVQEILASDSTIFGVKPTGYFGPLTQEALKKFQERYGLEVTGKLDEETREVMKELRAERKDGMVPPGLIKSEEVKDRIKARLQEKWGDCEWGEKFRASDCKKGHDDKDEDEDDDDTASSTDATRAEAEEALGDAREAIADLKLEIEEMEDDDADEDDIEDAEERLLKAQKKLADARRAFVKGEYDDAVEKAEEATEIASGDDSDDEDEDSDKDEDEDEDDEDENENEDDDENS